MHDAGDKSLHPHSKQRRMFKTVHTEQLHYWKHLKSTMWHVKTRPGHIITAPNPEKKSEADEEELSRTQLWTWSETLFKQRTKATNVEKKKPPERKQRDRGRRGDEAHEYGWEPRVISHQAFLSLHSPPLPEWSPVLGRSHLTPQLHPDWLQQTSGPGLSDPGPGRSQRGPDARPGADLEARLGLNRWRKSDLV